jgi:hypothetical protein
VQTLIYLKKMQQIRVQTLIYLKKMQQIHPIQDKYAHFPQQSIALLTKIPTPPT